MIPVGYMAKYIAEKPNILNNKIVKDLFSVSGCISKNFADYIPYWKHNGYWLYNCPIIIEKLAKDNNLDLSQTRIFYYEAYELQHRSGKKPVDGFWEPFAPEKSISTDVFVPTCKKLEGFDIVSFSQENAPECSFLSCNHMAEDIEVNNHCLLGSLEEAKNYLNQGLFDNCEPGPSRILAVYSLD